MQQMVQQLMERYNVELCPVGTFLRMDHIIAGTAPRVKSYPTLFVASLGLGSLASGGTNRILLFL